MKRLCELPTLNLDGRLFVLSDCHDPVADVDVFLSGGRRVREYALYNDVLSFHPQDDTDSSSIATRHFGGTR